MRDLATMDLFAFCRVVDTIDAKAILKGGYFRGQQPGADAEEIGFEVIYDLMSKAATKDSEKLIYEFLAGPFERTPDEIRLMPLPELFDNITKLAKDARLPDFFRFAANRMKSTS